MVLGGICTFSCFACNSIGMIRRLKLGFARESLEGYINYKVSICVVSIAGLLGCRVILIG